MDAGNHTPRPIRNATQALTYVFGGNVKVTLKSLSSGKHFTYTIEIGKKHQPSDPDVFWVSVLTGSDNTNDYTYIGHIRRGFFHTDRKTPAGWSLDTPSIKAFTFMLDSAKAGSIPEKLEIMPSGSCARCGRELTADRRFIRAGFGPDCIHKVAGGEALLAMVEAELEAEQRETAPQPPPQRENPVRVTVETVKCGYCKRDVLQTEVEAVPPAPGVYCKACRTTANHLAISQGWSLGQTMQTMANAEQLERENKEKARLRKEQPQDEFTPDIAG